MRFSIPALLALSVLCGCSGRSPSQTVTTTSVAEATVSPKPLPSAPSPAATPTATATATNASTTTGSAQPGPLATPVATVSAVAPLAAPNAPPRIYDVNIDKTSVSGGDTVSGSVLTSSNVASVEARVATYSIAVPKTGVGRFALSYTVPNLPFFLHRTYDMTIIARNTRGDATARTIPLTIR